MPFIPLSITSPSFPCPKCGMGDCWIDVTRMGDTRPRWLCSACNSIQMFSLIDEPVTPPEPEVLTYEFRCKAYRVIAGPVWNAVHRAHWQRIERSQPPILLDFRFTEANVGRGTSLWLAGIGYFADLPSAANEVMYPLLASGERWMASISSLARTGRFLAILAFEVKHTKNRGLVLPPGVLGRPHGLTPEELGGLFDERE